MKIETCDTNKNENRKFENIFQCEMCHKHFGGKHSLRKHIRILHLGVKNFHCQICEISFGTSNELKSHVRKKHPKDGEVAEKFYCDQCPKIFAEKYSLKLHIKSIHEITEKNFCCDLW